MGRIEKHQTFEIEQTALHLDDDAGEQQRRGRLAGQGRRHRHAEQRLHTGRAEEPGTEPGAQNQGHAQNQGDPKGKTPPRDPGRWRTLRHAGYGGSGSGRAARRPGGLAAGSGNPSGGIRRGGGFAPGGAQLGSTQSDPPQLIGHLAGVLGTRRRLFGEQSGDQLAELRRQIGPQRLQRRDLLLLNPAQGFIRLVGLEGRDAARHLIKEHAEGEKIGAFFEPFAARLLRRHGCERAKHGIFGGERFTFRVERPSQAKIEDLGAAVVADQDVGAFEVAVQQILLMRSRQAPGNVFAQGQQPVGIERAFGDQRRQRAPVDPLEHQNIATIAERIFEQVENLHHRRMIEPGDDPRLAAETGPKGGIVAAVGAHPFDRHLALQPLVEGQVDLPHAAPPKQPHQAITADPRSRLPAHGGSLTGAVLGRADGVTARGSLGAQPVLCKPRAIP